jgi:hypothetical protein
VPTTAGRSAHPFPHHPLQVFADFRKRGRPEGFLLRWSLGSSVPVLRCRTNGLTVAGRDEAGGQGIEEEVAGKRNALHRSDPFHAARKAAARSVVVGRHAVTLAGRRFDALNVRFRGC